MPLHVTLTQDHQLITSQQPTPPHPPLTATGLEMTANI